MPFNIVRKRQHYRIVCKTLKSTTVEIQMSLLTRDKFRKFKLFINQIDNPRRIYNLKY